MREYYVYEWIRLDTNEPFYIGKGKGRRWKEFRRNNRYFKNIINKVPVAVVILFDNLTDEEAKQIECWYIWQLRDIQGYNLVNLTDGGDGGAGFRHNQKHKDKMREFRTGMKASEETKRNMSEQRKGRKMPSISKALIGSIRSEETKNKQRATMKNRHKGENNPFAKSVLLTDLKGNVIKRFGCAQDMYKDKEWRKEFPKPRGNEFVYQCLKNKNEFHGHYLIYQ